MPRFNISEAILAGARIGANQALQRNRAEARKKAAEKLAANQVKTAQTARQAQFAQNIFKGVFGTGKVEALDFAMDIMKVDPVTRQTVKEAHNEQVAKVLAETERQRRMERAKVFRSGLGAGTPGRIAASRLGDKELFERRGAGAGQPGMSPDQIIARGAIARSEAEAQRAGEFSLGAKRFGRDPSGRPVEIATGTEGLTEQNIETLSDLNADFLKLKNVRSLKPKKGETDSRNQQAEEIRRRIRENVNRLPTNALKIQATKDAQKANEATYDPKARGGDDKRPLTGKELQTEGKVIEGIETIRDIVAGRITGEGKETISKITLSILELVEGLPRVRQKELLKELRDAQKVDPAEARLDVSRKQLALRGKELTRAEAARKATAASRGKRFGLQEKRFALEEQRAIEAAKERVLQAGSRERRLKVLESPKVKFDLKNGTVTFVDPGTMEITTKKLKGLPPEDVTSAFKDLPGNLRAEILIAADVDHPRDIPTGQFVEFLKKARDRVHNDKVEVAGASALAVATAKDRILFPQTMSLMNHLKDLTKTIFRAESLPGLISQGISTYISGNLQTTSLGKRVREYKRIRAYAALALRTMAGEGSRMSDLDAKRIEGLLPSLAGGFLNLPDAASVAKRMMGLAFQMVTARFSPMTEESFQKLLSEAERTGDELMGKVSPEKLSPAAREARQKLGL